MAATGAMVALTATTLVIFRCQVAGLFLPHVQRTSEARVTLQDCLLLIAASMPGDWANATLGGALQGAGARRNAA
jgi:Na+-driven multidrug efflux pump